MSIDAQAMEACVKWLEWVSKGGDGFWRYGNLPEEAIAEWVPGYKRGVQDRLTGVHTEYDPDHEWLWGYGEDLSLFKQSGGVSEIVSKCHAAGYVAGYQSIGG